MSTQGNFTQNQSKTVITKEFMTEVIYLNGDCFTSFAMTPYYLTGNSFVILRKANNAKMLKTIVPTTTMGKPKPYRNVPKGAPMPRPMEKVATLKAISVARAAGMISVIIEMELTKVNSNVI